MRAELLVLDVESKLLECVRKAWADYETREGPPPLALVKLLETLHNAVIKRVQRRIGVSAASISDLETMSIELAKEQSIVQDLIQQKRLMEEVAGGEGLH